MKSTLIYQFGFIYFDLRFEFFFLYIFFCVVFFFIGRGLEESNVDGFFDDVMVGGKAWGGKVRGALAGSYVFVCAHGSRDVRCGVCGPALIEKLNEEIQLRGLKDQISVMACSHVGGHKYAGNLIIYSPAPNGKIMGHW